MLLIVQGVFRSGTTALFDVLRQGTRLRCYYEPLHPRLMYHLDDLLNPRQQHGKSFRFSEYLDHRDELAGLFRPTYAYDPCVLQETDDSPQLEGYLEFLSQTYPRVVFKVNRAFWCSEWLHRVFPESYWIHIVRDPRAVVWSQLTVGSGKGVTLRLPLLERRIFTEDLRMVFSRFTDLGRYFVQDYFDVGRQALIDVSQHGLLSQERGRLISVRNTHPYVKALALWGAQVRICHEQARAAFGERYLLMRYEDFCRSPVDAIENIRDWTNQDLSDNVSLYAQKMIHTRRLTPWNNTPGAARRFDKGLKSAGLESLVSALGYLSQKSDP